jgi:hypothetical protein
MFTVWMCCGGGANRGLGRLLYARHCEPRVDFLHGDAAEDEISPHLVDAACH